MVKTKFRVPALYFFITLIYFGYIIAQILINRLYDLIPLFRISRNYNALGDAIVAFFVPILVMCLLTVLGLMFALINFKFMTRFQRTFEYYYVDLGEVDHKARNIVSRSLPAVFLCLAISLLVNHFIPSEGIFGVDIASSIIFLSLFITPIICVLLLPLYVFLDCGIVKIRIKSERKRPPQIIYFGSAQYKIYKGFAGITTPLLYIFIILTEASLDWTFAPIILLYPLFLIGVFMPMMLVYEKLINKWRPRIIEILKLKPLKLEDIERNIF